MKRERTTRETTITVDLKRGGEADVSIAWAAHGGLDEALEPDMARHLFHTLLRYADLGGALHADGDLAHHVVEDTAITLGEALRPDGGVERFAHETMVMDDARVAVTVDVGGRPYYDAGLKETSVLWDHVVRSLAFHMAATVHVDVQAGHDPHHVVECTLKAVGVCLGRALTPREDVRSTKGEVR